MVECPSCRAASPDGARFCSSCGTALGGAPAAAPAPPPAPTRRQERRLVTTLFCDLVGFTSVSEAADPEDLDRMLDRYFTIARGAIERHGGVVEKFIGDAVVGVFGAPAAHEDDPARAVRAGLAICAGATDLCMPDGTPLTLRVGVNTGEAFVHLDVRPDSGEHLLVGDAVNTAARIQSAAPVMGVAVGARTWQATRLAFDYERLEPASLKGKAAPVELFHARAEVVRPGVDTSRTHAGPFVGRSAELARLTEAWETVRRDGQARLAVIEGEPGIGKSRLLAELRAAATADEPDLAWLQGRCLPYGEGSGFWAFGEIVKGAAGIRDGDDAPTVRSRLEQVLDGVPDAAWILDTVLPLLGVAVGHQAERDERLEGWRRLTLAFAGGSPLVLAFEDVHWADPALLAFIETIGGLADAPLLVVVTTRPTIRELAPAFAEAVPGAVRIALEPLADGDTEALVTGLLGDVVPRELHEPILRRSEGNPLYAEEFVRLLGDRDLLERVDGAFRLRPGATIPVPESIHGLLASRLDSLGAAERSVLTAASVVGQAFWPGAVRATAGVEATALATALDDLAARQLVRPLPASTMAGEPEFAFWHVLARDVAYGSLPRGARIDAHLAVADWIRGAAAGRSDVASIVAHHVTAALELAEAAHDAARADAIRPDAIAALAAAGAATIALDADASAILYRRALDLATPGVPGRSELLYRYGVAAAQAGSLAAAVDALDEARALAEDAGDVVAAARAMSACREPLILLGDDRWHELAARAVTLLEPLGPSETLVAALTDRAFAALMDNPRDGGALALSRQALDMAAELGLPAPTTALQLHGQARLSIGDNGGFDDFQRAYDEAAAAGRWAEAIGFSSNYSAYRFFDEGPEPSIALERDAVAAADAHGLRTAALTRRFTLVGVLYLGGHVAEATTLLDELEAMLRPEEQWLGREILFARVEMALERDDHGELARRAAGAYARVTETGAYDTGDYALLAAAFAALGHRDEARALLDHALDLDRSTSGYWLYLSHMTRVALFLGDVDAARRINDGVSGRAAVQRCGMMTNEALVAEAEGRLGDAVAAFERAADAWASFGVPLETARAQLGAGRCLVALGRSDEARPWLASARESAERIGASVITREIDAILSGLG